MKACPACGGQLAYAGRRIGASEVLQCSSCDATLVEEADDSGSPTVVDPELELNEREGAT